MTLWRLVVKEILHRRLNFVLGLLSVVLAVGCLVGALTLLKVHDLRTRWVLERKEAETRTRLATLSDDVRKAMLKLGFNVVILPRDLNLADWYAEDYASKYMPEEYVSRLAQADIITIRHLLPSLQQKVKWPERKRTIILVGTRGEVPSLHQDPSKPLVEPVPEGTAVVGSELHQSLGLKEGDTVTVLGREFTVARCHGERGSKDDITVWISLKEAQELLDKRGLINAILALECVCAEADVAKVRFEIARILPDTQVVERGSRALARAEARGKVAAEARAALEQEKRSRGLLRREREKLASVLVPVVMVASAVWIAVLAFENVRERRSEIAILRALGLRSRQILLAFLGKAVACGLLGGVLGLLVGYTMGRRLGITLEQFEAEPQVLVEPKVMLLALVLAPLLTGLAAWLPATLAAHQDPAEILREE